LHTAKASLSTCGVIQGLEEEAASAMRNLLRPSHEESQEKPYFRHEPGRNQMRLVEAPKPTLNHRWLKLAAIH
jgi:hypothetical protein